MAVVISDRLLESSDRLLDAERDDQLVRQVQTGHEAAFAAIVRRYERELQAHARRLSADGRGEDAVQQAFLNAFAALQSGREVRHLRGWLHQILRHEVTRARVPVEAPLEATVACAETLEDTVARRATAHAALAELSALPDRQRDALLGTAVFGFPRAHVARTMGLSEGAVRQLVHRARLRLREAATAVIPFPLVKLFGAARSGIDANPEAALGAGTAASAAASGGLAIKVGALLASGALATGIAVTQASPSHHHAGAAAVHHQLPHAGATRHVSAAAASAAPAFASDRVRRGDHGAAAGEDGRADGGRGRLSGTRSGDNGPGAGREGGHGHDGAPVGRGDSGSGRSPGGAAAGGDHGGGSSSSSNSGSGSGSGSDSTSSGGGRSGSGSGSGHSGGSGSSSGSATGSTGSGSTGSGSGDGASSSDSGAGSGHSSGSGNASSTGGGADTTSSTGPSGTASAATATGDGTSGDHSGGGQDNGNVVSLGSDSSQTPSSGSGSGGGKENLRGSRDLSGSLDSSSS
jgi:RNA polymerase sigma factor (sigma-70 family)